MDTTMEHITKSMVTPPDYIKKLERSWFWITVFSFISMLLAGSSMYVYFDYMTELHDDYALLSSLGMVVDALSFLLAPMLLNHIGVFSDERKNRLTFASLTAIGIVALFAFTFLVERGLSPAILPVVIGLHYILVAAPAAVAGCAVRRAVKVCNRKYIVWLCGGITFLCYIITSLAYVVQLPPEHLRYTVLIIYFLASYILPLLTALILRIMVKDDFTYTAPAEGANIPKALFRNFLILAYLFTVLDAFYNSSYYAGGTYESYSKFFSFLLSAGPIIGILIVTFLLYKGKWLAAMVGCTLFFSFQQVLILFFNNNAHLALGYELADFLSGVGSWIFFLYIPFTLSISRRDNGFIVSLLTALSLLMNAIVFFFTPGAGYAMSALVSPAVSFLLSIITIGYLFYLYYAYTRNETRKLLAAIREGQVKQKTPRETLDAMALTPREKELASLLLTGEAQKNIADKMGISYATVRFHSNNLYRKLNIQSRAELFALFAVSAQEQEA